MGCFSSTLASDSNKFNNSLKGYYVTTSYKRSRSKRIASRCISSGVSSACTSPSRPNILSRIISATTSMRRGTKSKTRHFTLTHQNLATAFEMLSICDDFGEGAKMQQQQGNRSFGYYSIESSVSTPFQSCLMRTQDTSLRPESPNAIHTPTPIDLEMEVYMISHSQGFMAKTSSPILSRRNLIFNDMPVASPNLQSYQKWANYLQNTPASVLHNVTRIPEAIAGHFSPADFPAFTDLDDMESAAKMFNVDGHMMKKNQYNKVFYQKQIPKANTAQVITTDL